MVLCPTGSKNLERTILGRAWVGNMDTAFYSNKSNVFPMSKLEKNDMYRITPTFFGLLRIFELYEIEPVYN